MRKTKKPLDDHTGVEYKGSISRGESEAMAHTIREKAKLVQRVRRIRGQIEAVERALVAEQDCSDVLQLIAAARGAMNSLMAEVLEGQIGRAHV